MALPAVQGTLFKYSPKEQHCAFQCGSAKKHVVLVGGLTNGFLFCRSAVQPLLSSSYQGWGVSSLDTDADEIHLLAKHLRAECESQGFFLLGHSTGTQDAVRYAQRHRTSKDAAPLLGVILQASVSDRESLAMAPGTAARLEAAQAMVAEDRGEDILFRDPTIDGTPVCARRYVALAARGGDDDMFSSDLTDGELQETLEALDGIPTLVLMSGADQYVPSYVDKDLLTQRIAAAAGAHTNSAVIPAGKHDLEGCEEELVTRVLRFITDTTAAQNSL